MVKSEPRRDPEALGKQVALYMDVYKHHFDLFVKGTAVYLAIVGTVAGLVFKDGTRLPLQVALCIFVMLISCVGGYACYWSDKWVCDLERVIRGMIEELEMEQFPFWGARRVVRLVMLLCILFCAAAGVTATLAYL